MPKNPFSPRLLKKVQMQGGAPGTHPKDGCLQMGLFQQPASFNPASVGWGNGGRNWSAS
jgi:hypothetical protein